MRNRSSRATLFVGRLTMLLLSSASVAQGVPLNPDSLISLSGTTVTTRPSLAGTVLADTFVPFAGESARGEVETRVVRETMSETLDFYFRVFVEFNPCSFCGSAGVAALRIDDVYPFPTVDVDFLSDSPGDSGPDFAWRVYPQNGNPISWNLLLCRPATRRKQ